MKRRIPIERDPQPNEGQKQAITKLENHVLVSAGAGSGKTWVLTERYLEKLSHGYHPSQIVAITFTEKAAGEMRNRIRQAVQNMAIKAASAEERSYWEMCEQDLKQSVMTTIHGFCARLLRSHPVEVGLDPDFRVLDPTEARLLMQDQFVEATRAFLEKGLGVEDSAAPVSGAALLYEEFSGVTPLVQAALELFDQMRTDHVSPQQVLQETRTEIHKQRDRFERGLDELDQLLAQMHTECESIKAEKKKWPKYITGFEDWLQRYEHLRPTLAASQGELNDDLLAQMNDLVQNKWRKAGTETFKEMTDELREEVLPRVLQCMLSPRYEPLIERLLQLVKKASDRYEAAKAEQRAVDFQDLEILAARLLGQYPQAARKWQNRISFLMVDEFQDTNGLQKQIIDALSAYGKAMHLFVVGDGKQSIYRFRGADVQVFYRMEEQLIEGDGEKVALPVNFRTQAGVIAYVNSLFSELMQKKEEDPHYYTLYEHLEAHRRVDRDSAQIEIIYENRTDQEIEAQKNEAKQDEAKQDEAQHPADSPSQQHWSEREADILARRIKQMVEDGETIIWKKEERAQEDNGAREREIPHPAGYGDIAVLLAARTQISTYEYMFQEYGIPYVVAGGRSFYHKQEVLDVINVLKLVHYPDDEVALLAFLRSPMAQLKDSTLFWLTRSSTLRKAFWYMNQRPDEVEEEQWEKFLQARTWLQKWLRLRQWEGLYSLLTTIIEDTQYLYILMGQSQGEQRVANVYKLLDMVRRIVDEKGHHLYDFVHYVQQVQEENIGEEEASMIENRGDAVVLMSVHASKGLEFPVVCIPEIRKDVLRKGGPSPRLLYHPGQGLGLKLKDVEKGSPGNGLYEALQEKEQDMELQEAKRLLYVAMTRARDHLLFVASKPKTNKHTWLRWIMDHVGLAEYEDLLSQSVVEGEGWKMKLTPDTELRQFPRQSHEQYVRRWQLWKEEKAKETVSDAKKQENSLVPDMPFMFDGGEYASLRARKSTGNARLPSLSATALGVYRRCPRQFYLTYIEGLYGLQAQLNQLHPRFTQTAAAETAASAHRNRQTDIHAAGMEPVVHENDLTFGIDVHNTGMEPNDAEHDAPVFGSDTGRQLSADARGTLVHNLIERFPDIPEEDMNWQPYMKEELEQLNRESQWQTGGKQGLFRLHNLEQELAHMQTYMRHYERFASRINQASFSRRYTEQSFTMLWRGQTVSGIVDRLHIDKDGKASIYDFKTNLMNRPVEEIVAAYRWQGYLYTFLVEKAWPVRVCEMRFVFLQNGEEYVLPLDRSSREQAFVELDEHIEELQQKEGMRDYAQCADPHCVCKWVGE